MYNGIGLNTARGSGTNGFVQRNLSFISVHKHKPHFRTEEELQSIEAEARKGPNLEILEHVRKRALELKCIEMEDVLKDEGYPDVDIEEKVTQFRKMLMDRDQKARASLDNDFGRGTARETHAVAAAQQQKNARLKEAFGISEYFVEGSSLDPDRKAKEEAARQMRLRQEDEQVKDAKKKKYEWVSTPSPSPGRSSSKKGKKDKKKSKRHRDRSSSRDSRKKHKSKKSKRSR